MNELSESEEKKAFQDVCTFLSAYLPNRTALSLETRVNHDLGFHGDDAFDILMSFSKEFSVDMTGLEFERHFYQEYEIAIGMPLGFVMLSADKLLGGRLKNHFHKKKTPVSVGTLVRAVLTKVWPSQELAKVEPM